MAVMPLLGQGGAVLYESKCAACHGANGAGRSAMAGSNLLTDSCKKKTDAALREAIAEGGQRRKSAHAYEKKGLTAKQVEALVAYVRELQKK